jgi:hypothetical protein
LTLTVSPRLAQVATGNAPFLRHSCSGACAW